MSDPFDSYFARTWWNLAGGAEPTFRSENMLIYKLCGTVSTKFQSLYFLATTRNADSLLFPTAISRTQNSLAKPCSTAFPRYPCGSQAGAVPVAPRWQGEGVSKISQFPIFKFPVHQYSVSQYFISRLLVTVRGRRREHENMLFPKGF